jgi:hypothetical protein
MRGARMGGATRQHTHPRCPSRERERERERERAAAGRVCYVRVARAARARADAQLGARARRLRGVSAREMGARALRRSGRRWRAEAEGERRRTVPRAPLSVRVCLVRTWLLRAMCVRVVGFRQNDGDDDRVCLLLLLCVCVCAAGRSRATGSFWAGGVGGPASASSSFVSPCASPPLADAHTHNPYSFPIN